MDPSLYRSARDGNLDVLRQNKDQLHVQLTANMNTLLHVLAQFNDSAECVREILGVQSFKVKQCMLTWKNSEDETALYIASRNGNSNIARALIEIAQALDKEELESGAKIAEEMMRAMDRHGDTALHTAVRNNHIEVVNLLVTNDRDFEHPVNKIEETPLYLAVEKSFDDIVDSILIICTSPSYNGPGGKTALHAAVFSKSGKACASKLLEKNSALTKQADESGWTPLHYAAYVGHSSLQKILLKADRFMAYMTASKDDNKTALHIAACKGHVWIMEELLAECPDCWDMVTSKGQNILHLAVKNEREAALSFILSQPWAINLINQKDAEGNTPLHIYVNSASKSFDGTRLLTHPKVDVNAVNKENFTPLDLAQKLEDPKQRVRMMLMLHNSNALGTLRKLPSTENPHKDYFERDMDKEKQRTLALMRKIAQTHLLVATLIATVTFAAGFTLPGGYDGNEGTKQGMAILIKKAAFKIFVITDTIAVVSSILAVFLHFTASLNEEDDEKDNEEIYFSALIFILIAMIAMVIAFFTGLYTVLDGSLGLAISVCFLGCYAILVMSYRFHRLFGLRGLLRFVRDRFFKWDYIRPWVRKVLTWPAKTMNAYEAWKKDSLEDKNEHQQTRAK